MSGRKGGRTERQARDMSKAFFRIGAGLRCAAACVILSAVPPQWEVEYPRRNEIERDTKKHFPSPVSCLLRPAVYSTNLRGAVFANGGRIP